MKQKLLIALFILAVVVCVFASCGECKHENYQEKETIDATCVADGKKIMECTECGETKEEVISKTGIHDVERVEIEPTCNTDGKIVSTCKVCGDVKETKGKDKTNIHKPEVVIVTEATCTTDGVAKKVCTECKADVIALDFNPVIPATGHTYDGAALEDNAELGVTIVEPNCENDGYVQRVCQTCQYDEDPITLDELKLMENVESTFIENLTKWGHNHETFVETVAPTCMEAGYTVYKCVNPGCEDMANKEPVDALGHDYIKGESAEENVHYIVTLKPTCIATGEKVYICIRENCGELATEAEHKEEIPMVEHNILDDGSCELISHFEADCLNPEKKTFKCNVDANCNEQKEFTYGKALDHNWQVSGEQTCKTEGKTPWKCERVANGIACEATKLDDPTNAEIRHTYGSTVSASTCVADAVYKCSVCEEEYNAYDDDIDGQAHGEHAYTNLISTIAPTCSTEGYGVYSCTAGECGTYWGDEDGEYNKDVTPRIDHTFNQITEDGRIVCTVCSFGYRDVTTEITTGSDPLCLGCGEEECTCKLTVEWNGYVSPKAPFELKANEEKVISEVEWTVVEQSTKPLSIGEGIIILNSDTATKFTIKLYDAVDGTEIGTIVEEGSSVQVDLYKYETVVKVAITAEADATVALYSIVK